MNRRRDSVGSIAAAAGATLVLALLASSCRQIVGIEDRPLDVDAGVCASAGAQCPASPFSGCDACTAKKCSTETKACAGEKDCKAFQDCRGACGGMYDCVVSCATQHAAGSMKSDGLDSCLGAFCSGECGFGDDWSCAGSVSWPTLAKDSVTVTLKLVSALDRSPPPEPVPLKLCRNGDDLCLDPIMTGTIDGTGAVTGTIPVNPTSYPYGLDCYAESEGTKSLPVHVWGIGKPLKYSDVVFEMFFFTRQNVEVGASIAKVVLDPTRGNVSAVALDCSAHLSPFADFRVGPTDEKTIIARSDRTNFFLTHPTLDPCRLSGRVLFINVPTGIVEVEEYRVDTCATVGTRSVPVRAGGISIMEMGPTP